MQTFTANEAKTRFGEFLDRAQRSPVGVLVSAQDYEAMRQFYADRLQKTFEEAAAYAAAAGMTPEILDQLLADES